jgi:polygalacturonase/beta-xylosidase
MMLHRWILLGLCFPALAAAAVDVTKIGVVGDGVTLETSAIQQAIDTCAAGGGGTLTFPAGRYLTGTLQLKDGVTLHLDEGAVLLGSPRATDYRSLDPFTDATGAARGYALIVAMDAKRVALEGPGAIDGQGAALKAGQSPYAVRPFLVRWVRCSGVAVRQVRLRNAGAWTMHVFQSSDVTIEGVDIHSRGLANNDGIDIDSCDGVRVVDCGIDTGDDAICLKTTSLLPCRRVTVTGCRLTSACAAIKFGTESLGDFDQIRIDHCAIRDTRLGGIKLLSVDGADLHGVVISDITMERVTVPIMLRLGARLKTFRTGDSRRPPGRLRDVTIRRVRATAAQQIGILISGVPGHPVEAVTLDDIAIQLAGGSAPNVAAVVLPEAEAAYPEIRMFGPAMPASGIYVRHARGMRFANVRTSVLQPDGRPPAIFVDVEDPTPAGFTAAPAAAASPAWGDWPRWGDQHDGTYRNPVLPSDYSDLDCIRVGADYYAISSTFQFSPGVVILHSRDLVNWAIAGHAVPDLTQIGPELNWDRMNRAGRGIWAGAIRWHAGRFWIYFGTPDEGYFMTTAPAIAGPWTPLQAVLPEAGWDDCCPFWDDDGQGYLVGSHFRDGYKIHLWKLTPEGRGLVPGSDRVIHQSRGSEANKLYKFGGLYYHFFSEVKPEGRVIMMERAAAVAGPYAEERQLKHADREAMEPNQGGFVTGPDGRWYFFTHHGHGSWEGRAASLLPVTWIDGWPIVGVVGPDGLGRMAWSGKMPATGLPAVRLETSDEFGAPVLAPQWEWNYQPRADHWSLTERPGWLRLHAFPPLQPGNLLKAGNTLTQRCLRTAANEVIAALDLSGLADGQRAGLCHFAKTYSALGVEQDGAVRRLVAVNNGVTAAGPILPGERLWLRSVWGLDGQSRYSFSLDGQTFTEFGPTYPLAWGNYRGDRLGLYSYNPRGDAGYVDVDYFHYDYAQQENDRPPRDGRQR